MTNSVIISRFKTFILQEDGTSTIEFALTVPFLLAMLLFTIAANDSVNASTEIGKVTVAVADILSQSNSVTKEVIDATFDTADVMMNAKRGNNLEMFVVGVEIKADGTTEVLWTRDNGNVTTLVQPGVGGPYDLPPEVLVRTGFIVSARARLTHSNVLNDSNFGKGKGTLAGIPIIGNLVSGASVYDYESNFVPRSSIKTSCDDC